MAINEENSEKSLYNEGMLQIQRLNESWERVKRFRRTGELDKWRFELQGIQDELAFDALKMESDSIGDYKNNIHVVKLESYEVELDKVDKIKQRSKFYRLLREKEVYLRWLQNTSDKGARYVEYERDAVDY